MNKTEELYYMLSSNPYFDYFSIKTQYERRNLTSEEIHELYRRENRELAPYSEGYDNPFMDIKSYEDRLFCMFSKDDFIVVQEKIDGSNAHLNVSSDGFRCYSSRRVLNEHIHLQGYWFWCRDHFRQVPEKYFGLDIYGEWLIPHHCRYPKERYGDFYVFDVMENGQYWMQDRVEALAEECGFQYAPVLFRGIFDSWSQLMPFVGETGLGGKKGEGIVVKNQTTLNSGRKPFYIKIVDREFQETNKSRQNIKTVDMDKVLEMERQLWLAAGIVTVPRVRKILFKLVDEKLLPVPWTVWSDKEVLRIVKPYVYKDCLKEESVTVNGIGKAFGRYCNDFTFQAIQKLREESLK